MSRKGGTGGGGGWVHPKGVDSMAVSGLGLKRPLVEAWWAISLLTNGLRNRSSRLVGPPFLAVNFFPNVDGQWSAESRDY